MSLYPRARTHTHNMHAMLFDKIEHAILGGIALFYDIVLMVTLFYFETNSAWYWVVFSTAIILQLVGASEMVGKDRPFRAIAGPVAMACAAPHAAGLGYMLGTAVETWPYVVLLLTLTCALTLHSMGWKAPQAKYKYTR